MIYFTRSQKKKTIIKLRVKSEKTELPRKAKNNYINNYVRRIRKDNPHVIIEGTIMSDYGNKRQFSISHVGLATSPYVKGACPTVAKRISKVLVRERAQIVRWTIVLRRPSLGETAACRWHAFSADRAEGETSNPEGSELRSA